MKHETTLSSKIETEKNRQNQDKNQIYHFWNCYPSLFEAQ